MKDLIKSYWLNLLLLCVMFFIGFFIGRSTVTNDKKTEYVKGEMINGSVSNNQIEPTKETKPDKPILPLVSDTIYLDSIIYIVQKVDSAAIIADYILKKDYQLTLFDNKENGKLTVAPTVQYNKLTGLDYSFTPIQRVTTITKERTWQPFASASYSTFNYVGIGAGAFYHDIGFEIQYQTDFTKKGLLISGKYKF